jgi:formylglycine-generating enzyme required for sulfatase activity
MTRAVLTGILLALLACIPHALAREETLAPATDSLATAESVELRVPDGFVPAPDTQPEPYTNTGWAKDIIHEKTGVEMVFIPAGEFMMGAPFSKEGRLMHESPVHRVRISKPFYLGRCEVTVGQFGRFPEETDYRTDAERGGGVLIWTGVNWDKKADASWHNPYLVQSQQDPVVCVSWNDTQAFLKEAGNGLRLPTEAEWEYACRAGSTTAHSFGNSSTDLEGYAWYKDNSGESTHPVGQKLPNAWGLFDMHGNVWEWCQDWYGMNYYKVSPGSDPTGPRSGTSRIVRGGSWAWDANRCRSAYRLLIRPAVASIDLGFRPCLGLP